MGNLPFFRPIYPNQLAPIVRAGIDGDQLFGILTTEATGEKEEGS